MSDSRITPAVLYRTVLLAFGLAAAGLIFDQIITLILGVLIVVICAIPLSAFTSALQRMGVPRGLGAVLGLLLGLGLFGGLIALIVPIFTHEIHQFTVALPGIVDSLRRRLGHLTGTSPSHVGRQVQHFVSTYTSHPSQLLGPLASVGASVVTVITSLIVVLLTVLYTAIHPQPLAAGLVRMAPPSRRSQVAHILDRLRLAYLGWLRGLAVGMLVLGGITYLGLRIVGLSFAAFFAIFTAVAMIVPYFGALLSSVPPIIYALTISPEKAVLVAVIYILAHQLEGNVIQPLVVARTVELHPAVVAIGVVAVERLLGFAGLIVAVPILATIRILIDELWIQPLELSHGASAPGDLAPTDLHPPARIRAQSPSR